MCYTGCLQWPNGYHIGLLLGFTLHPWLCSILSDRPLPLFDVVARRALRSTTTEQLLVPQARLADILMQRRTFSVAGPSIWNDLPLELRLLPMTNLHVTGFYKALKSFFLSCGWAGSRFVEGVLYKCPD